MGIREDFKEVKKEVEEMKEQSFALELLSMQRRQNKRLFIMWIITFVAFIGLLSYTVWLLNDIGEEEITTTATQEVSDIETIDDSYIINGDNNGKD